MSVHGAGCSPGGAAADAGAPATASDASDGAGALAGDDRLFVPEGLPNTNQDGQDVGLMLVAFTLVQESSGPAFYAAVQNVWSTPLCEAGMTIDFYDRSGQSVGSAAGVLQSGQFFQLTDGSGTIIPCVAPGQIAMTGETGLPDTIAIDQLGSLVHLFPSFNVAVVAAGALTVDGLQAVGGPAGTSYSGTVGNEIGAAASNPGVAVFPINRVGRPLGMATASASVGLAAGGSWDFQSGAVGDPGVGQVAYASASVP
ncbi:MAG TPA: hypothetical protein VKZ18_07530 [Polyangia bacterium]|nr:hypothetical protein [Polyangia bacterium]